jgi:hypothetical protein
VYNSKVTKHLVLHKDIRTLRSQGLTYSEINEKLNTNIPKSSLSYICKGIVLNEDQAVRINSLMREMLVANQQKAVTANRVIQETLMRNIKTRAKEFSNLSDREAKLALALLYLGEGSKYSSFKGLALGSSDPKIILIYMGLLKRCYGINAGEFKCRVLYRADQDLNSLEKFWSNLTSIPGSNFYKTKPDQRSVGKPTTKKDYKGVCVLYRKGTQIQLELQFIADIIGKNKGM